MKALRSVTAVVLALALCGSVAASAYTQQYDDFDEITSHVSLSVPQETRICSPAENLTTAADAYYLSGTSDPESPLYLNGDEVPGRGIYGSWGVYAPLYDGKNTFTLSQNGKSHSVSITKQPSTPIKATTVTSAYPQSDSAYSGGDTITFACTAPSGAEVWVRFGSIRINLEQTAEADPGMPARFKATHTIGGVAKAYCMGNISYTMTYDGNTGSVDSAGQLYLFPNGSHPVVKIVDTHTTTFSDKDGKSISTIVKGGAYDYVMDQTDNMYLLGMGSWVPKTSTTPSPDGIVENTVAAVAHSRTSYGERLLLRCNTNPITTSWHGSDALYVKLHNTTGLGDFSLSDSRLFSDVTVTEETDGLMLTLTLAAGQTLWGHTVEYADGLTTIYAKYPPTITGGEDKPLHDIVVGLDAGHGGSDPGAFGTAQLTGPVEKDINLATAMAVKKRLESLGASVIMTTYHTDQKSSPTDRMQAAVDGKADFYISLHCNSVAGNGLKPNGIEIYYYYTRSKPFADAMLQSLLAETGRKDRGVKHSSFRVTLNSLTPAILVEMGFISNPVEFDRICSHEDIFKTANAVGNGIVNLLQSL